MEQQRPFTLWPSSQSAMHAEFPAFDSLQKREREIRRGAVVLFHLVTWLMPRRPIATSTSMNIWARLILKPLSLLSQCWHLWALEACLNWHFIDQKVWPLFRNILTTPVISVRLARERYRLHVRAQQLRALARSRSRSPLRPPGHWGPPMPGLCAPIDAYPHITAFWEQVRPR